MMPNQLMPKKVYGMKQYNNSRIVIFGKKLSKFQPAQTIDSDHLFEHLQIYKSALNSNLTLVLINFAPKP